MGSITRSFANNIGSSGILSASAVTNATVEDVTAFGTAPSPATLVLISTQTASNSATISFTSGLDSTYDMYEFHFINIKCTVDENVFEFNGSTDGGSNYNVTKTSTFFQAYHTESDVSTALEYATAQDLAQSTNFQKLTSSNGNGGDDNLSGTLQLFNPSSTTYVKHFISNINHTYRVGAPLSLNAYNAGYMNTTSAINSVRFRFVEAVGSGAGNGNISDGIIKLYGVKKS